MKIAITVADISPSAGGLYYSVRAMSVGASGISGNQVEVFAMGDYPPEVYSHWAPLRPKNFSFIGPRAYRYAPGLQRAVSGFKPEIIHSHGLWMYNSRVALSQAKSGNAKLIVSPRGMLDAWALSNSAWKKKIIRWLQENSLFARVDCFHALNISEAASIRSLGLLQPICVIPNGTDLPAFNVDSSSGKPIKKIVFIGRIHPKKGLQHLIDAWSRLLEEKAFDPKVWRLVIAGWDDGGHLESYREQADKLGCSEAIEWPGAVYGAEKARLLKEASAFILPSFSEGLPMAIVEAWSYGLPVVMTPQCNLPEGFECGAALQVEAEANSLEQGLKKLLLLTDLERTVIGDRGRKLVEKKFTWDRQIQEMQKVYRWLLKDGDVPATVKI